MQKKIYHKL